MIIFDLLPYVLAFVGFNVVDAEKSRATTRENYYSIKGNVGYESASIIEQMQHVSQVYCLLQCGRVEGCNHIAFNEDIQLCYLLQKLIEAKAGSLPDKNTVVKMKIYSLGE